MASGVDTAPVFVSAVFSGAGRRTFRKMPATARRMPTVAGLTIFFRLCESDAPLFSPTGEVSATPAVQSTI